MQKLLDIKKIVPSPFQVRKHRDEEKLKELAASILRDGQIAPIVVRRIGNNGTYQNIAGGRRLEAIRKFTDIKFVQAIIIDVDDLQARRISTAENIQREYLSAIETIEAMVKLVDAELIEDKKYASMGKNPADRVKTLLGKLHSTTSSKNRGSKVSKKGNLLLSKFTQQVEEIFESLPKPLNWRSFYLNDLPLVIDFCQEVQEASMQNDLNGAQTRALQKLKAASGPEFKRLTDRDKRPPKPKKGPLSSASRPTSLKEMSAREIENIAERAVKKKNQK